MSKHAAHNEAACDFLLNSGQFNDWVVTTAFYSSLHYVKHELFPLIDGTQTYNDFNSFYSQTELKKNHKRRSKHQTVIFLVFSKMKPCIPYYRWLHDA